MRTEKQKIKRIEKKEEEIKKYVEGMKINNDVPYFADVDITPEGKTDKQKDTYIYLLDRMTALYLRKDFLKRDFYENKMKEYCERLLEVD